jgi:hypothetical protein
VVGEVVSNGRSLSFCGSFHNGARLTISLGSNLDSTAIVAVLLNALRLLKWFRTAANAVAGVAVLEWRSEKVAAVENLFRECANIKKDR